MTASSIRYLLLGVATFPFIYYALAIYSAWRFFGEQNNRVTGSGDFTPPVSILKPVHGIDPEPFDNFTSFCQQNYPEYEVVFCVDDHTSPVLPIIDELRQRFPDRCIRVLYGSGLNVANDKVAKLIRLVSEAQHEVVVINDSDVRVDPNYLRTVVSPLEDGGVGAVTCFYVPVRSADFVDRVQSIGMFSDFYAGILVARNLDGVKFTLGPTIATTRTQLARFGGYETIANRPADDMLVGRLIAAQGSKVELLPYAVKTVADYRSFGDLFQKRLRWMVVMRHMRPFGHLGLIFTFGLAWSILAAILHPSTALACGYFVAYGFLRSLMTCLIGVSGLKQNALWKELPLIPVWDALAFAIWLLSFTRNTIRWRDGEYRIRKGELMPLDVAGCEAEKAPTVN